METVLNRMLEAGDFNSLTAEITKSSYFNCYETSDAEFHEQLLGYWRKISDDKGTEELIETAYKKAWTLWKKEKDEIRIARSTYRLALFIIHAMEPNRFAKELIEFAVKGLTDLLGETHLETAQAINDLGYVFDKMGQKRKSLSLYKKALSIRRSLLSPQSPEIAESLNNVASHYSLRNALPYLRESLEIRRTTLGGAHADTMNSLRNLGAVLDMLGQTDEADALLVEAITICETVFGYGSDELASALDYYGVFLWHNNFHEAAPSIAMRSLQIKETIYGSESVKLLGTLQLLADAYRFNKQFDEAVLIVERALKILRFSKIECEPSIEDFEALSGKIDEERRFAEQHENDERRVSVKRHLN